MWWMLCTLATAGEDPEPAALAAYEDRRLAVVETTQQGMYYRPRFDYSPAPDPGKLTGPTYLGSREGTYETYTYTRPVVVDGHGAALDVGQFVTAVGDPEGLNRMNEANERARRRRKGAVVGASLGGLAFAGGLTALGATMDEAALLGGVGLGLGAMFPISVAAMKPVGPPQDASVFAVYSEAEVRRWVALHNQALMRQLGLNPADVAALERATE